MVLPFRVPDLTGGLTEAFGLVRDEGECLVFEFQTKDTVFGITGKMRQVRVPLGDIAAIRLERGWFGRYKLVIRAERLESLAQLPGVDSGKVVLKIAKADRPMAEAFLAQLHR